MTPGADRPRWLFRADASATAGVGHVVRCLTLAEAATARGRRCSLLSHELPIALAQRAEELEVTVLPITVPPGSVADGGLTAGVATEGVEVVVVDGYHLGCDFRAGMAAWSGVVVCLDDNLESGPVDVDVIVNHGPHARSSDYSGRAETTLLGPSFALVRKEITNLLPVFRERPARRAVVTMGGADVQGATVPICAAILERTHLTLEAVTGLANPRSADIRALAASSGGRVVSVSADGLPGALARADVGVIAAGGTLWEAAALGLPTVAVVTAENQRLLTQTAEVRSFAFVRDFSLDGATTIAADVATLTSSAALRATMTAAGTELVDGRGAERVVTEILAVVDRAAVATSSGTVDR